MLETKEAVIEVLPPGSAARVTDEVMRLIKMMGKDTGIMQDYMENQFMSNASVLKGDSRTSIKEYVDALRFVTLKQRMTNEEAWKITFPDRVQRLKDNGTYKNIGSNVSMYNKKNLVVKIEANMIVDFNRFYDWARHEAMMKNVHLMRGEAAPTTVPMMKKDKKTGEQKLVKDNNGNVIYNTIYHKVSPVVQQLAASKILEITKPAEEQTVNLKIALTDEAIAQQKETSDALRMIAIEQRRALMSGANIEDVQVIGTALSGTDRRDNDEQ
jgi:hypothetical protein